MPLDANEQRLCAHIGARSGELLADLAAHVAIPTGTGHRAGIDEYRAAIVERLVALGGRVELVPGDARPEWLRLPHAPRAAVAGSGAAPDEAPPTAIVTRRAGQRHPSILIAGHLDTVHDPHGDFRLLSIAPDGATATGPGAADMKGGILVAVAALESLAANGIDLPWTFLLNADEETGSFHSAGALRAAAAKHRIGLALEPALPDGSLVVERMGTGQFRVEVLGRAAHVGRDFANGVSAVFALAKLMVHMEEMIDLPRGAIVNVGPIAGGLVTNAVPDHAACWGNVRFADESVQRELEAKFAALATVGERAPGGAEILPRVVVDTAFNRPAKLLTPEVRRLAEAAQRVGADLGQRISFGKTGGVCDGNILQAAGLPTIDTLGVRGGNLHRTDEFVEVASLVERCRLFAVLMARLMAG
ncbi:MAG: M20/M25/M40 family metallo-hydrolase [Phycisphaerales bacterium]